MGKLDLKIHAMDPSPPELGYIESMNGKPKYSNPVPTVDIIIEMDQQRIVLIERKNPPFGWALPGGFVEYGEKLEAAAIREAREETSLDITLAGQFHTYSDPKRDPRQHNISTVFVATAKGNPKAASDARNVGLFSKNDLPESFAFDHKQIVLDFFTVREKFSVSQASKQFLP